MSWRDEELKSLDLVQRWVISVITIVVGGAPTIALAAAPHVRRDASGAIVAGLAVMSALIGLLTALAVLIIHRRRRWGMAPVLIGLLPAAVSVLLWTTGR